MKNSTQTTHDAMKHQENNEYKEAVYNEEEMTITKGQLEKLILEKFVEIIKSNNYYSVWLSYDLGLEEKADKVTKKQYNESYQKRYNSILGWLKARDAQECGKSVATFIAKASDAQSLKCALKKELQAEGIEGTGVRVYVVISDLANFIGNQKGFELNKIRFAGFIIGEREVAAWEEYKKPGCKSIDIE